MALACKITSELDWTQYNITDVGIQINDNYHDYLADFTGGQGYTLVSNLWYAENITGNINYSFGSLDQNIFEGYQQKTFVGGYLKGIVIDNLSSASGNMSLTLNNQTTTSIIGPSGKVIFSNMSGWNVINTDSLAITWNTASNYNISMIGTTGAIYIAALQGYINSIVGDVGALYMTTPHISGTIESTSDSYGTLMPAIQWLDHDIVLYQDDNFSIAGPSVYDMPWQRVVWVRPYHWDDLDEVTTKMQEQIDICVSSGGADAGWKWVALNIEKNANDVPNNEDSLEIYQINRGLLCKNLINNTPGADGIMVGQYINGSLAMSEDRLKRQASGYNPSGLGYTPGLYDASDFLIGSFYHSNHFLTDSSSFHQDWLNDESGNILRAYQYWGSGDVIRIAGFSTNAHTYSIKYPIGYDLMKKDVEFAMNVGFDHISFGKYSYYPWTVYRKWNWNWSFLKLMSEYNTLPEQINVSNSSPSVKTIHGTTVIADGSTTGTIYNNIDYTLEDGITSDNSWIHMTNSKLTAGGRVAGGWVSTRHIDDTTAWIDNADNIENYITFKRYGATDTTRVNWEIMQFIGEESGPNEWIVRKQGSVSAASNENVIKVPVYDIAESGKVCVFITAQGLNRTATSFYSQNLWTSYLAESGSDFTADFTRLNGSSDSSDPGTVSYAVVEFNGSSWRDVQRISWTMNQVNGYYISTTADGNWGGYKYGNYYYKTFPNDILDTNKAFLHTQFRFLDGASASGSNFCNLGVAIQLLREDAFTIRLYDSGVAHLQNPVVWIVEHTGIEDFNQEMLTEQITMWKPYYGPPETEEISYDYELTTFRSNGDDVSLIGFSSNSASRNEWQNANCDNFSIIGNTGIRMTLSEMGTARWFSCNVVQWPREDL